MVTSHIEFTKLKLCISFTHHSYYWSLILSKITLARIIYLLLSLKLSLTNLLLGRVWFISNKETHQKAGYKKKKKKLKQQNFACGLQFFGSIPNSTSSKYGQGTNAAITIILYFNYYINSVCSVQKLNQQEKKQKLRKQPHTEMLMQRKKKRVKLSLWEICIIRSVWQNRMLPWIYTSTLSGKFKAKH